MKKCLSVLLSLSILCFTFLISPLGYATNKPLYDQEGYYPWLSIYNHSNLDGYSSVTVKEPFEENNNYPIPLGNYKEYGISKGIACYNNQVFFLHSNYKEKETAELKVYDIIEGEELESIEVKGNYIRHHSPIIVPYSNQVWVSATYTVDDILSGKPGGYITCIDLNTQEMIHEIPIENKMYGGLQYSNGYIYYKSNVMEQTDEETIQSTRSFLTKLDASTGEIAWEQELPFSGLSDCALPSILNNNVFVSGYPVIWKQDDAIQTNGSCSTICLDASTGEIKWTRTFEEYDRICSPSADKDQNYVIVHKGLNDNFYEFECLALNNENGKTNWSFAQKGMDARDFTPKISKDYVIVTADYGYIFVLDRKDGSTKWDKRVKLEDYYINFYCPGVVISGNKLLISCWHYSSEGSGNIIMYAKKKKLLLFSLDSGKQLEKFKLEEDMGEFNSIAIYGGGIVLANSKNYLDYIEATMPRISIKPKSIDFGEQEQGSTATQTISVHNHAFDGLEGTVTTTNNASWLEINPTILTDDTDEITVTANTKDVFPGNYSTSIEILSNGGNKRIPVTMKVIDTSPPDITLQTEALHLVKEKYYTNQNPLLLQGSTESKATLEIQGKSVPVSETGTFQCELSLQEGLNSITALVADEYDNQNEIVYPIVLDTKPPIIQMETKNYQLFTDKETIAKGTVQDCCKLFCNQEEVPIESNGYFSIPVSLELGVNKFTLQAFDYAGNEASYDLFLVLPEKKVIILQIGNTTAEVNGKLYTLDVAPVIKNSTTMVPFRFIGEAMEAEIEWIAESREIVFKLYGTTIILQVDNAKAKVNDKEVTLSVPPTIISGRTVIPIRFVSENLGAKVGWDGSTQQILITYPNPE